MRDKRIQDIINTPRMSNHKGEEPDFCRGLYELIKKNFKPEFEIIQIGTYEGVSAALFALTCAQVITIDPYDEGYNFTQESKDDLIRAEQVAKNRLQAYPNVKMIKLTGEDFYSAFAFDILVDAIYIDGDHSEDGIKTDLNIWPNVIKEGGFLSGHDWGVDNIQNAVLEIIGKPDNIYEDGSWIKQLT